MKLIDKDIKTKNLLNIIQKRKILMKTLISVQILSSFKLARNFKKFKDRKTKKFYLN